ncbi:serine/threonine-protein kinase [Micromonospora yangpuensis]|uniref:serine/threonine-protein kinase n=1 Tax=Micromonospora yangpuensis TaxID=683228 RepID=UPI0031409506
MVRNGAQLLGRRYRLVEQLGAGGMSVVWRGYDEVLGRQVAVKVLASRLASDRAFRHRIRIEAQAAARLAHPNITGVYDYGESVQVGLTVPYVVMELVDGVPLSARLGRDARLPWREAVTIGAEVASALAAAHARGVVHRDVSPGNVMLTATGVKVVDFGISALVGVSEQGADGTVFGTPAYVAPERLDDGQVLPATDVYAVGLLLYRMLTGGLPWDASSTTQLLRAHMFQDPEPLPPVPGLPDAVTELVGRCLAKRPEDRPGTAELARTLADAAGVPAIVPVSPAASVDPGVLANAGTTILPWRVDTDALPFTEARRGRRMLGRRAGGGRHGGGGLLGRRAGGGLIGRRLMGGSVDNGPVNGLPVGGGLDGGRQSGGRLSGGPRVSARRRRVEAGLVAAGFVAVTAAMWGVASQHSPASGGAEQPTEARMGLEPPVSCAVAYTLRSDNGREFAADLTLTNTGRRELRDWTVHFSFPAEQKLTRPAPTVRQQGETVLVRPAANRPAVAPGKSEKVALTGTYTGVNPLPVEFRLGETRCGVQVAGVAGTAPATKPPAAKAKSKAATKKSAGSGGSGGSGGSAAKKQPVKKSAAKGSADAKKAAPKKPDPKASEAKKSAAPQKPDPKPAAKGAGGAKPAKGGR